MIIRVLKTATFCLLLAGVSLAQEASVTVEVGDLACVPLDWKSRRQVKNHGKVDALVRGAPPGASVRLYYRRMHHEIEDFYFTEMRAAGDGVYWGIFPDPEDRKPKELELRNPRRDETAWAEWWKAKESSQHRDPDDTLDDDVIREKAALGKQHERTWLTELSDEDLQTWLEELENEPVEYFATVSDPNHRLLAQSEMKVTPVIKRCSVELTPQQTGESFNLTVGETAHWQRGKSPFHWQCQHIVTRIDNHEIKRADGVCRCCVSFDVHAWLPMEGAPAPEASASVPIPPKKK